MLRKFTLACYFIILVLLIIGCQPKVEEQSQMDNSDGTELKINTFNDDSRPDWWENIDNTEILHSYAFVDGSDQDKIKVDAINSAQVKFLHYQKGYIVNLTSIILEESGAKDKIKSKSINAKNSLIFKKDYSQYLKRVKTEFIPKDETNYRCFVAIGLPLDAIQNEYVNQFQKAKSIASYFAKSKTYRYLLKKAGLEIIPEQKIVKQKTIQKEVKTPETPSVKYDVDVIPAWFKISYNNKKVMVNKFAVKSSTKSSEQEAIILCNKSKMKIANIFARTEAEKYRKASGYDEIKFNGLKNQISNEVQKNNYPLTKEYIKTIQIGKNKYKTYAQYSLNKKSIQNSLVNVLKTDDVLYSRLRASMNFDELEDEDF